jgi:hypothetical protein
MHRVLFALRRRRLLGLGSEGAVGGESGSKKRQRCKEREFDLKL